jgi:hypothetical protein
MTVIALAGGALVLYSPVRLEPDLRRELAELGEVRCVIATNRTSSVCRRLFHGFP